MSGSPDIWFCCEKTRVSCGKSNKPLLKLILIAAPAIARNDLTEVRRHFPDNSRAQIYRPDDLITGIKKKDLPLLFRYDIIGLNIKISKIRVNDG